MSKDRPRKVFISHMFNEIFSAKWFTEDFENYLNKNYVYKLRKSKETPAILKELKQRMEPLDDNIVDKERFIAIFIRMCEEMKHQNHGRYTLINYNEDTGKFWWNGIGNATIPTLGQLLHELKEQSILRLYPKQKIPVMDKFLIFFDLNLEIYDPEYLSLKMYDTNMYNDAFDFIKDEFGKKKIEKKNEE